MMITEQAVGASLTSLIPDYAKDIRLNLGRVLSEEGGCGLTEKQRYGVALAASYALKEQTLMNFFSTGAVTVMTLEEISAIKSAASIMVMTNSYYRTMNHIHDASYKALPMGLRMQIIGNSGIIKTDFELYCMVVSAINNCAHCIDSHVNTLTHGGVSQEAIHWAIKITAVIQAAAQALVIEKGEF